MVLNIPKTKHLHAITRECCYHANGTIDERMFERDVIAVDVIIGLFLSKFSQRNQVPPAAEPTLVAVWATVKSTVASSASWQLYLDHQP